MVSRQNVPDSTFLNPRLIVISLLMPLLFACGGGSETVESTTSTGNADDTNAPASQYLGGSDNTGNDPVSDSGKKIEGTTLSLNETSLGLILAAGENKRSVYTFSNDSRYTTTCTGSCAVIWPPVVASSEQAATLATLKASADPLSLVAGLDIIERADFSLQMTLYGMPLYHYSGDGGDGETNGENIDERWFVARPIPVDVFSANGFEGRLLQGRGSVSAGIDDPALRRDSLDGLALYIFTPDTGNTSTCNAGCSEDWPPLYADRGAVPANGFTLITRQNGAAQWAYGNQPLYFYIGDDAPGVVNGDGADAVWFVARP